MNTGTPCVNHKTKTNPSQNTYKGLLFKNIKWIVLILLGLFLILSVITTLSSNRWIRKEISERQLSLTKATADNLNYRFSRQAIEAVNLMTAIYPYLSGSSISEYEEYAAISKQVNSKDLSPFVPRIFVPDSKVYSSQQDLFFPLSSMKKESGLSDFYGQVGISWIKPHEIRYGLEKKASMIGCLFTMNRMDDYSTIAGSVVLYYPVKSIIDAFGEISQKNEILLVDSYGEVLAGNGSTRLLEANELEMLLSSDSGSKVYSDQVLSFCKLNDIDWYVVIKSYGSVINLGTPFTIIPLLVSVIMFVALIIAVSVAFNIRQMNKALLESMEARYKQKLELSNYQMQALQEQIKPHFLYNSLDIIRWMIADGKKDDAVETITALSKYLRMSISKKSGIVPMSDELELAETYVEIIKKRSSTQFSLVIDVADNTIDCRVPRFILQPILENSLIHGILGCAKPDLELKIRSWIDNERLFIEIEDNGKGIPQDTLSTILKDSNEEPRHGYGLKNTKKRLEVFNGPDTIFEIHSKEHVGTCVSIGIKATHTNEP